MENLAFDWFLLIRIFVWLGLVVLMGYFFTKGLSLFLNKRKNLLWEKT